MSVVFVQAVVVSTNNLAVITFKEEIDQAKTE